jgi:hypothetical protein
MTSTTSTRILVIGDGTGRHTNLAPITVRALQARLAATGRPDAAEQRGTALLRAARRGPVNAR